MRNCLCILSLNETITLSEVHLHHLFCSVVVLDKGNIVEFDSPANLLAGRGIFYSMARDAGLA